MRRKHKILIVHEDARIAQFFDRIMQAAGRYEIRAESDPTQAAQAAADFLPDLVLLDLGPQKLSARAAALRIREDPSFATTPIILVASPLMKLESADLGVINQYPWLKIQEKPEIILQIIDCYIPKRPEDSVMTAKGASSRVRGEPIHLSHCLQGWPPEGPNHFRWEDEQLLYSPPWDRSLPYDDTDKTVIPTLSQWNDFWRICDEIDVWAWPPWLGDEYVCDGLQWSIRFAVGDLRVESEGQLHSSPDDFDGKLKRLHHALQRMTGWQPKDGDW
jgi:CheY-like chemotaxis protein